MAATTSYDEKIRILRRNATNTKWTDFLLYQFGKTRLGLSRFLIFDKWAPSEITAEDVVPFVTGEGDDLLEYLTYMGAGNKKAVAKIHGSLTLYPAELHDFLIDAVLRDLEINVSAKQVNTVYGAGTVYEIPLMMPGLYYGNEDYVRQRQFTVSGWYNGTRCAVIKECGEARMYTRFGIVLEGFDELLQEFNDLPFDEVVFDGELVYKGEDAKDLSPYDRRMKERWIVRLPERDKSDIIFYIYDILSLKEFNRKTCKNIYKDRRTFLETNFTPTEHIQLAPILFNGRYRGNILKAFRVAKEKGYAGILVNLDYDLYKYRQNSESFLYLRQMHEADLMIVDYTKKENEDILQSFIVDYKGSNVVLPLGYSDEERKEFWEHRDDYLGRIAHIHFSVAKRTNDGSKYWLPGAAFLEMLPVGSPIRYNDEDEEIENEI